MTIDNLNHINEKVKTICPENDFVFILTAGNDSLHGLETENLTKCYLFRRPYLGSLMHRVVLFYKNYEQTFTPETKIHIIFIDYHKISETISLDEMYSSFKKRGVNINSIYISTENKGIK